MTVKAMAYYPTMQFATCFISLTLKLKWRNVMKFQNLALKFYENSEIC